MNRRQIRFALLILSFLLMSVTFMYISPFVMIMGLAQGVIVAGLIFWIVMFVLAFFIGRVFCGFACPLGAEQELIDRAVRIDLRPVKNLRSLKYLLAVLWVGAAIFLAYTASRLVFNPLFQLGAGLPPWNAAAYVFFYGMTLGVFVLVLILGKRGICNYFCPMSVVFIAITALKNRVKIPSLHLAARPSDCIKCKKCTAACPMSLPVQEMVGENRMQVRECILCGSCVETCPKKVIRYSWFWK
ncbi:MAG: 4Fe-4S binding protein [Methanoregula sp.]|nr:4Fe-4S binding protein [Methanoregula sp.]